MMSPSLGSCPGSMISVPVGKIAIDGYVVRLELPELQEMVSLLRRSSNNLNQLAHTANAAELAGTVTPATYAGILAELQTLADSMKKAIRDAD